MTYFYVEPEKIQEGKILLEGQVYKHIIQVRRCREGEIINLIDGTSREYQARIQYCRARTVIAEILQVKDRVCESPIFLTLYQSMIRVPRFEMILEKAVELGVSKIVPVISERSVFNSKNIGRERIRRWNKIIISAACQSGRTKVPELREVLSFKEAIESRKEECFFIFTPYSQESSLKRVISHLAAIDSAGVFIGPEGGFSPDEIEAAKYWGALEVSLGPRILRTETAAIASVALLFHELENRKTGDK